jgi:hypothetical protein
LAKVAFDDVWYMRPRRVKTPPEVVKTERGRAASMVLVRELRTYEEKLPDLLAHVGKFVLIHDDHVAGFFDTYADAVQAGYQRFELKPFLVKQVQEVEQVQFIFVDPCPA